jgi:60 kDa SS-A/Ro ribonucleoprotein
MGYFADMESAQKHSSELSLTCYLREAEMSPFFIELSININRNKMSRFNTETVGKKTVNYMGAKAYRDSSEFELISAVLTSFAADAYYEKADARFERITNVLKDVDPEFAAKVAIFARDEFNMRSMSHVLASELAPYASSKEWAKRFYEKIVVRPDDMMEIVSYLLAKKAKLPNALKKGFANAFAKFDEYQLAKYRGDGKSVKLVDIVNLVHPKPTDKNSVALKKLISGDLKSVDTWETKLTQAGQVAKDDEEKQGLKKEVWVDLVRSKKIGYFALLRNLRNILKDAPEIAKEACALLINRNLISKSRVLPFRYLSSYQEIEKTPEKELIFEKDTDDNISKTLILNAIEEAIGLSIDNLPLMEGRTLILSDNSGSMTGDSGGGSFVSAMSKTKSSDIANLFAVMYWTKADNTLVGLFGDRLIIPSLDRTKGLFENFKIIDKEKNKCGASTERGIFDMFEKLIAEKTQVDTIVVFSDCQIGDGCQWYDHQGNHGGDFNGLFQTYKKINPSVTVFSVNLKGYGTDVFSDDVFKMSGWSEKIFDIMQVMKQDRNALISKIKSVSL